MSGTCWVCRLGDHPGWNVMSPCGLTIRVATGGVSGVVSGVCTLGGGVNYKGLTWRIFPSIFRSAAFCLYPNVVSGIVGIGFRMDLVRSVAACVAASLEESLGNVSVSRGKSVVSETLSFAVLRM